MAGRQGAVAGGEVNLGIRQAVIVGVVAGGTLLVDSLSQLDPPGVVGRRAVGHDGRVDPPGGREVRPHLLRERPGGIPEVASRDGAGRVDQCDLEACGGGRAHAFLTTSSDLRDPARRSASRQPGPKEVIE